MILLDFDLGSERVIDFLHECREQGFIGQILVVTAGISGRQAIQSIQAGVYGIVHKHRRKRQRDLLSVRTRSQLVKVALEKNSDQM